MTEKIKTTNVAVRPSEEGKTWTEEQVSLIKNTVAKGATDDELKLFLYTAKRTGLDPLTKQIHFVKRAGQMTIQTGIDGYRAIAERTQSLAGIDDVKYEVSAESNQPTKATVTVYRFVSSEKVPFTASARWSEYAPQGNQAFMWKKMPFLMLGKCAEALALRKAFPNDLTGLYTNEEMGQAEVPTLPKMDIPETPVKKIDDKAKLVHLCRKLNISLQDKEQASEEIQKLTGLEPNAENRPEIVAILEVLAADNDQK